MDLGAIREAIRSEGLDGWLFHNFMHRDPLSDAILGVDGAAVNSRRWLYALKATGEPVRIVHAIEAGILDRLPGTKIVYDSFDGFAQALGEIGGGRWACQVSGRLPVLSTLDAGTYLLLKASGIDPEDSSALVQRAFGILTEEGISSHERAVRELLAIVRVAWARVANAHREGRGIKEGELRDLIIGEFEDRGLVTDHPPIVGAGISTADPHYSAEGAGRTFKDGDPVQIDLWAKEGTPGAVYADISWIGVFSAERLPELDAHAEMVFSLRDAAISFMREGIGAGRTVTGRAVDARVRSLAAEKGVAGGLRHRTGHGIDTACHGSGVNLDSVEFPDDRAILPGSCFSVEPGLYFERRGFRTEVDAYRAGDSIRVSGGESQGALLYCGGP